MVQRFFPLDRNYILREVQAALRDQLLQQLVNRVKQAYYVRFNPLGLLDDTILQIQKTPQPELEQLYDFYHVLAGIYRYKNSCNQLELPFDGRTPHEKYTDDWEAAFAEYTHQFLEHDRFVRAVLVVTVFYPRKRKARLAEMRMRSFLHEYFALRVDKRYGIRGEKESA